MLSTSDMKLYIPLILDFEERAIGVLAYSGVSSVIVVSKSSSSHSVTALASGLPCASNSQIVAWLLALASIFSQIQILAARAYLPSIDRGHARAAQPGILRTRMRINMRTAQSKEKRIAVDADMSQKGKHVSSATWFLTSVDFGDNPPEMFLWKDGVRFAVKSASGNMEGCGPVQAVCRVEDSDEDVIKVSVSFLGIKECCTAGLQFGLNVAHIPWVFIVIR